MKENMETLDYKGKEYALAFDINVLIAIQDRYGTFTKWMDLASGKDTGEYDLKSIVFAYTEALNEGIEIANEDKTEKDELLTEKQVARMILSLGAEGAFEKLSTAAAKAVQGDENSKNASSTKTKKTSQ